MIEVSIHYPVGRKVNEPDSDKVRLEFIAPKRPFLWWGTCREAERIQYPKGYGVAYYDWCSCKMLFAPMPLNVVIGWFIWAWHWVRTGCAYWYMKHRHKTYKDAKVEYLRGLEIAKGQARAEGAMKMKELLLYGLSSDKTDEEIQAKAKELGLLRI